MRRPPRLWLWLCLGACAPAAAQLRAPALSLSSVGEATLADGAGRIALNLSAGAGNAQANLAALGIADAGAAAALRSEQLAAPALRAERGAELASIGPRAFERAGGMVALNQSSGAGNAQVNLAAVVAGAVAEVSIEQLGRAAPAPPDGPAGPGAGRASAAFIADSAFAAASGVVQVNQLAGAGNAAANVFSLSVSVGAR